MIKITKMRRKMKMNGHVMVLHKHGIGLSGGILGLNVARLKRKMEANGVHG
ncbi:hypothetical protein CK203_082154 [Vitis vinifera]|uniref:Uncharacterized protein n=1 Tax=Vitis vinifera TaxID=29760 RepID=A0A438CML5_VITVI|nr:hypothetical protein CK203_082154 [Vitis vinifera]